ncbi:DMT family transporter [Acidimangrovimonas sediminis]|uniref:DMT family transporter n=1 Tax=Acidimangrovimonas sediminis TaxID=2056283 RepID=UPI000C805B34|nr:multidrug efflux SMR transporter [Acidimangrovimonas sediminis]
MAWITLAIAGVLEVVWAFYLKKSAGFTVPLPSIIAVVTMVASFFVLSLAMRSLPLGTAYAVWTGIGTIGAFLLGVTVLGEAVTPLRLGGAVLIVAGLVVMKLSEGGA